MHRSSEKGDQMTEPCFAYLRVSGLGQLDGDGFDRQFNACSKYAAAHNWDLTEVFREEGVCGANELENRPALQRLLAALEASNCKTILIERLDRLARDLMVQETIIADLRKSGYQIISTMEPDLCSDDPSRKLMRQIFGAIAEYDRAMTVLKLRGARERKRARHGRCEGRKPFGFHPEEAVTLAAIVSHKELGLTCKQIAETFNLRQVASRTGRPWTGPVVAKILRRQVTSR
jgi:DNA invertase Pin-like site-specific DNA recombinase